MKFDWLEIKDTLIDEFCNHPDVVGGSCADWEECPDHDCHVWRVLGFLEVLGEQWEAQDEKRRTQNNET